MNIGYEYIFERFFFENILTRDKNKTEDNHIGQCGVIKSIL